MILVDLSSAFHKAAHGFTSGIKKQEKVEFVDLMQYQSEFYLTLLNIVCSNISRFREYSDEIVICLDDASGSTTWRKKIYPMYKQTRRSFRQSIATFDYEVAYKLFNNFCQALKQSKVFNTVEVPECEADDLILVLAKSSAEQGKQVLILSPDKDFLQLQNYPNIRQYSWVTNKMFEVADKDGMENWILEHICLGDVSDNVPRIVDFLEFKPGVEEFLQEAGLPTDPYEFSCTYYEPDDFEGFGGVFERKTFGISTLKRLIIQHEGLENFLNSNPTYRKNFYRNKQLVMEEGIPTAMREKILSCYSNYDKLEKIKPCSTFVESLNLQGKNLPDILSNKYITEQQLDSFLDW